MGDDTLARIADKKYYKSKEEMNATFDHFTFHGARFVTYPRKYAPGIEHPYLPPPWEMPPSLLQHVITISDYHDYQATDHSSSTIRKEKNHE
jgi:hypothetical protein